jgi:hypothetical protein
LKEDRWIVKLRDQLIIDESSFVGLVVHPDDVVVYRLRHELRRHDFLQVIYLKRIFLL